MANQRYHMHSQWQIAAPLTLVWQTVANEPEHWAEWWPELCEVKNLSMQPGLVGSSFTCTWQSHVGYNLRSDIVITEVKPEQSVRLAASGDLVGTVTCEARQEAGFTIVDVDWQIKTTKRWMNRLTPLLRPIFTWSHHAVMWRGERGLRSYLANKKTRS